MEDFEKDLQDIPLVQPDENFDDRILAAIREHSEESINEEVIAEMEELLLAQTLKAPDKNFDEKVLEDIELYEGLGEIEDLLLAQSLKKPSASLDKKVVAALKEKPVVSFSDWIWNAVGIAAAVVIMFTLLKNISTPNTAKEETAKDTPIKKIEQKEVEVNNNLQTVDSSSAERVGFNDNPIYIEGVPYKKGIKEDIVRKKIVDKESGMIIIITKPKKKVVFEALPVD